MIGRGTRLSPTLVCADESGSYVGKKYFYIFDYLRNFEYFREEKNGIEGGTGRSLSERIFAHKCAVIKLLQESAWAAPEFADYRAQLVREVKAQIDALNTELTPVHLQLRHVVHFQNKQAFDCLSDDDLHNLTEHIAPLVFNEELDGYARGFDNFCYGIMEAQLAKEPASFYRGKIQSLARTLVEKVSIKAVRDALPRLQNLCVATYYDGLTVLDYERIRTEIRGLAQFAVDNVRTAPIFVNYEDELSSLAVPSDAAGPVPADSFDEYKKRVDFYLREHMQDEAIAKLRTNQPLTGEDFARLDRVFKQELGSEKLFDELSGGKSLGVFIRHVTKMEKSAVDAFFAEFINDANMNALQIEFVQRLINIIVEQGEVNVDALMKGRAPFDRPKFFTLFGSEAQQRLFAIVRTLNANAKGAA
jgi:type I restriction enzyme R subunit